MRISDLISMCLQNLTRRKVRTMLTVIGVVVGTCAIVVMISIGVGMKESQEQMLSQMGDLTLIEVYNYSTGNKDQVKMDDKMVAEIQALPGVDIATPFYRPQNLQIKLVAGKDDRYEMNLYNIVGIYPEAAEKFGYKLNSGSFFDENSKANTLMFGQYAAYQFRDTKKKQGLDYVDSWPDANGVIKPPFIDPTKEKITLKTTPSKENAKAKEYDVYISGILEEDYSKGYETSRGVFMNINDVKRLETEYMRANGIKQDETGTNYEYIKVKATSINEVEDIETFLQDKGFDTYSLESIRKPMEEQAKQQQMVLGCLGAISLFVAALGITNTMIMSIYERTREIGVMKVLGCFVGNIRTVFLMEAGLIGFLGGVIGVVFSYGISFAMNYFGFSLNLGGGMGGGSMGGNVSVIPPWLIGFALVFATFIGLASGFYPANRAVQISALEAIKHD